MSLKGLGVAVVTPFNPDYTVDYKALDRLIDSLIEAKADYLVILATTSEAVTLSEAERHEIARFVSVKAAGRIPLIVGMSNNCTRSLVEHLRTFDYTGYSAILSVVPYYNKPSQEGIYQHFKAVAEASPIPVVLYNVPSRTGRNMEPATTIRLACDFPGKVIGIKEASGNLAQVEKLLQESPDGFQIVSGDDALTLPMIRMGAKGVISVVGNAYPAQFGRMVRTALADPSSTVAEDIHEAFLPLDHALFEECNPGGIKCLLSLQGMISNVLRLPLVPVAPSVEKNIAEAMTLIPAVEEE